MKHQFIKPVFAWYDLWIGVYVDRVGHYAYILPIPCVGVRIGIDFMFRKKVRWYKQY